jgi:hypothetical protein
MAMFRSHESFTHKKADAGHRLLYIATSAAIDVYTLNTEVHHIAVLDDIFLTFQARILPASLAPCFTLVGG